MRTIFVSKKLEILVTPNHQSMPCKFSKIILVLRVMCSFQQYSRCIFVCLCVCVYVHIVVSLRLCVTWNFDVDVRVCMSKNTRTKPLTKEFWHCLTNIARVLNPPALVLCWCLLVYSPSQKPPTRRCRAHVWVVIAAVVG
jgi:hypothetical protein